MIRHIIFVGAMALAMSARARAQGVPEGADHGARVGEHDAGPVGAVVGGVVGGVIGGVNGLLGIDDLPGSTATWLNVATLLTNIAMNFASVPCSRTEA